MSNFYIPARRPSDWKLLLAEPNRHWRTGHSAKLLAYCWQKANDFPASVREVFNNAGIKLFKGLELLVAFPEWKVALPGGKRASQNDIFILARGDNQLVSIMVEGKARETFGEIVTIWKLDDLGGKGERLSYLCDLLELDIQKVNSIRYQLLHRTASALIEAHRYNAKNALMLVHSFSPTDDGFDDYCQFLNLFDLKGRINSLEFAKELNGINLYFGWVREVLLEVR